jgi:hypothetical protein
VALDVSSFNWSLFNWVRFTWAVPGYYRTFARRPARRRVMFFAAELRDATAGRDLSLADLTVEYRHEYDIK